MKLWGHQQPSSTPENGFHDGQKVSGTAVPSIGGGIGKNTRISRHASSCHLLPAACLSGMYQALWMGSYLERWGKPWREESPHVDRGGSACRGSVSIASAICSDSDSKMGNAGKLGPGPLFPNPWPQLFLHRLLGSCPETLTLPGSSLALPPRPTPLPINADGPEGRHRSPRRGGAVTAICCVLMGGRLSSALSVHPII